MILLLVGQVAIPTTGQEAVSVLTVITKLVEAGLIPWAIWMTKMTLSNAEKLNELSIVLIGVDGKNGLRSRFIRMERQIVQLRLWQVRQNGAIIQEQDEHNSDED